MGLDIIPWIETDTFVAIENCGVTTDTEEVDCEIQPPTEPPVFGELTQWSEWTGPVQKKIFFTLTNIKNFISFAMPCNFE